MAEQDFSALDRVPFRVTEPTRIPVQRYYDPDFYRLENERFWPHVWQMACRLEEIPEVGDWVEYDNLGQSVIVVNTRDGIKAYHNACRHRGVKLANGGAGNCAARGFQCPFHGWRWNMEGENTFVFGRQIFREEDLDPDDLKLVSCRVETWGGCAFINLDDDAPPLLDTLGEATQRLDSRRKGELKVDWWYSAVLPVNWKLAMEAFMESYHVMATHPQLHAVTSGERRPYGADGPDKPAMGPTATSREYLDIAVQHMVKLHEGMGGMITPWEVDLAKKVHAEMDIPDDVQTASGAFYAKFWKEIEAFCKATGRPSFDLLETAKTVPFKAVEYIFPNYFLLPMYSGMSSYRVRPLSEETCLFEIWSLAFYPEDEERPVPTAPKPTSHDDPGYPEIPTQDYSNLPLQQLGLHAKGFEFMRLSPKIEGMISNYQRVIDGFIAGLDPKRLAVASSATCSGFDAPLVDLGF